MEPTAYDESILGMLAIDSDPFRNGTDCCCIVHTNAGRYKQALNELNAINRGWFSDSEPSILMEELEDCCRNILRAGYRMAEITAKLYVLGMVG